MKKHLKIFLVLVLALAVIGLARTGPAWAGFVRPANDPVLYSPLIPANVVDAPIMFETTIEEDTQGLNIGGVCLVDVDFKNDDKKMKIEADARVPLEESRGVLFNVLDFDLFFPGCRFIHYESTLSEDDFKIAQTISSDDVATKVCFGANPNYEMNIYYYFDLPGVSRAWTELDSRLEDQGRLICADAPHSAVYMPAGKINPSDGSEQPGANPLFPDGVGGSVLPPASRISFAASGEYAVGGVCIIRAEYKVRGLSNEVWVAFGGEEIDAVPLPDYEEGDIFYFPGCSVEHYRDATLQKEMNLNEDEGEWELCFADRPGKQMTIYYYQDDPDEETTPSWVPLETIVENGLACAKLVNFSAIYVPASR